MHCDIPLAYRRFDVSIHRLSIEEVLLQPTRRKQPTLFLAFAIIIYKGHTPSYTRFVSFPLLHHHQHHKSSLINIFSHTILVLSPSHGPKLHISHSPHLSRCALFSSATKTQKLVTRTSSSIVTPIVCSTPRMANT